MDENNNNDLQVTRGTRLSSHYIVRDLVGNGTFANVAKCTKLSTKEMVAVRITKIESMSQAEEEDNILLMLKAFNPDLWSFVRWGGSLIYRGHLCQEFELLDMSLLEFVNMRPTRSLHQTEIRPILYQVATALEVLRSLGIAHTDLKPDNIMLVDHVRQPLRVKIIDFGSALVVSEAEIGLYAQTRWYRSPEIILGLPCNEAIDMWSLGCIAARLFLGHTLYPGRCEYQMLWLIEQTQGELPQYLLKAGINTGIFYRSIWPDMWELKTPDEFPLISHINSPFASLDDLKEVKQTPDRNLSEEEIVEEKADLETFVELVKQMLQLDPAHRITPSQVWYHPFMTRINLVDFISPEMTSSEGYQSHLYDQSSPESNCGAQSPQNPLALTKEDEFSFIDMKPLGSKKRAFDEVSQKSGRSLDSTFSSRKKSKISGGSLRVKRPYSETLESSTKIQEIPSVESKRRRITPVTEDNDQEQPSTSTGLSADTQTSSQRDNSTSGSTVRKKKRKKDLKIWIIGGSYIRRAEEAAYQKFGENFGLHAKVKWFGKESLGWSGVLARFYGQMSRQSPPDILVIHAGGNDLGLKTAMDQASMMKDDLMTLHENFPSMIIAYSCINERRTWRHGIPCRINKDRKTINKCMKRAVAEISGFVIDHPHLKHYDKKIFVENGVNFTEKGNEIFVTSIGCALNKILQKCRM